MGSHDDGRAARRADTRGGEGAGIAATLGREVIYLRRLGQRIPVGPDAGREILGHEEHDVRLL